MVRELVPAGTAAVAPGRRDDAHNRVVPEMDAQGARRGSSGRSGGAEGRGGQLDGERATDTTVGLEKR